MDITAVPTAEGRLSETWIARLGHPPTAVFSRACSVVSFSFEDGNVAILAGNRTSSFTVAFSLANLSTWRTD